MRFEILDEDGNVTNTIVADEHYMNMFYGGNYRVVPDPVDPREIEIAEPVLILKNGFVNRFTAEEWSAVSSSEDADILAFKNKIDPLKIINIAATSIRHDLEMLVDKTILTEERMTTILTSPIVPETETP